jgi:hypothetical protein
MEPSYPDLEELLATAEQELIELKRQEELNRQYGRAVRELDAGRWEEARLLLINIAEMEPDFRNIERLLARAEEEVAREEAERQRQAQVGTWYEQALGLAQAGQWPQVLAKMQEIWALDPGFADSEGLAIRAQVEIKRAEAEAVRQTELAALYAEAVNLLKAQEYQAALDKWREVQALDPHYRDRQKVQRTAKKKLRQLSQTAKPRRRPDKRLLWLVPLAAIILIAVAMLLFKPFDGGAGEEAGSRSAPAAASTQRPVATSAPAVVVPGQCPEITAWQAEYWNNMDLRGNPVVCRDEQAISLTWGKGPGPGVPSDNFSARFTRTIDFPEGTTRFYLWSDDGSRLWVDNVLIIDQWHAGPNAMFSDLKMSAGDHNLRLEYFQVNMLANIDFGWAAVEN